MRELKLRKGLLALFFLISLSLFSFVNTKAVKQVSLQGEATELTILSYNVENLFDTINNPLTDDDEFLPTSERRWTKQRYYKKLHHIAKVISRAGGVLDFPAFVGLLEVENNEILEQLIHQTDLANAKYQYIITHSPDRRGLDVALLYSPKLFTLLEHREIEITFPSNLEKKSRNILHVSGLIGNQEPLHLFVCHAPSRRGGARATQAYRNRVMQELKKACQEVYEANSKAHIVLMGDFNASLKEVNNSKALGSRNINHYNRKAEDKELQLFNIMSEIPENNAPASYCYKGHWEQLDQFIISQSLLRADSPLSYQRGSVRNYAPAYIQRSKQKSAGFPIPWRTYLGTYYIGGYSDHYPILMKLTLNQ